MAKPPQPLTPYTSSYPPPPYTPSSPDPTPTAPYRPTPSTPDPYTSSYPPPPYTPSTPDPLYIFLPPQPLLPYPTSTVSLVLPFLCTISLCVISLPTITYLPHHFSSSSLLIFIIIIIVDPLTSYPPPPYHTPPTNQSINRSIDQSINQSINHSPGMDISKWMTTPSSSRNNTTTTKQRPALTTSSSNKTAGTVVKLVRVLAMSIERETNVHALQQVGGGVTMLFPSSFLPTPSLSPSFPPSSFLLPPSLFLTPSLSLLFLTPSLPSSSLHDILKKYIYHIY